MRIFALMPKGVDLTPCRYCSNPIAEYQCAHEMGGEYAPCKQVERMERKRRGQRLEILWVCITTAVALSVLLFCHN